MNRLDIVTEALAAIHESMESFYEIGVVSKQTMREFDEACLTPIEDRKKDFKRSLKNEASLMLIGKGFER